MGKIQKHHSPQFKADVVLESLITGNVSATANRNQIHEEEHKREYEIKGGYLYKEDDGIQHNFDKRSKASIKSNNDGNRKC